MASPPVFLEDVAPVVATSATHTVLPVPFPPPKTLWRLKKGPRRRLRAWKPKIAPKRKVQKTVNPVSPSAARFVSLDVPELIAASSTQKSAYCVSSSEDDCVVLEADHHVSGAGSGMALLWIFVVPCILAAGMPKVILDMGPFKKSSKVDAVIPANSDVALPSAVNLINTVGTLPIVAIQPFQASNPSGVWIWFFLFHMPLSSCRGLWRLWIPMGSGVRRLGQGSPPPHRPCVAEHVLVKARVVEPEHCEGSPAGSLVFRTGEANREKPGSQMQQRAARCGATWW